MKSQTKESSLKRVVQSYIRSGYAPIPVPDREKAPMLRGWTKLRVNEDQIDQYFGRQENVGLLLGKPSRGLVDVDLDAPEAAAIAESFLPETGMVHGRKGKRSSHHWYRVGNPPTPQKFTDVDGSSLLEIRSTGQQTLAPPSTHPCGEKLRWEKNDPPKKVEADKLIRSATSLAGGALVIRHYPEPGSRNDFTLALAGTLLKAGWSQERVATFIEVTAQAVKDEEWRSRVQSVSATAEKIANGDPVTGIRRLGELIGKDVVQKLQSWLRLSRADTQSETAPGPTDLGNARRFVAQHGDEVRYCYAWKKWLVWDGTRWRLDENGQVERRAKSTALQIYAEASRTGDDSLRKELVGWARASESRSRLVAMVEVAKSEPTIPVSPEELDSDPWLLNCSNGTIDLRTGELLPPWKENLCTKIVPIIYDPTAKCPKFKKFLGRILKNNAELINFLQRACGYSLTGSIAEQALFIFWGSGANGKSTLLELWREALGDYGRTADAALLMRRHHDTVRNDVARLAGARFVSTSETEAGRQLAEVLVKQLVGGDKVAARFLYSEFFEFDAQFKLFLTTNHKPVIRGTDYAIWRRIRLVPFEEVIPMEEQDKELPKKLRAELPGFLAWAVRGCLRWQEKGLGQPEKVSAATEAYREEMDVLGAFLKDRCVSRKDGRVAAGQLYEEYVKWCERTGERPLTQQKLGGALADRNFQRYRTGNLRSWLGLELRDTNDGSDATLG
jgi:putative DNA primase/helicase